MQNQRTPAFAIFDDYRPTVAVTVIVRWLLLLFWFALANYRAELDLTHLVVNLMGLAPLALNGYMTWRIVKHRPITWRHALALSLTDLTMITAGLYLTGGLQNTFYVFYYPALLGFSLMFPRRASFGIAALVIALYVLMSLTVAPTLDRAQSDEKKLAVRTITMLGMVAAGSLITRWERTLRRDAVAAERQRAAENLELQRKAQQAELAALEERTRIAREIHDGIAQSLYMLNISLEACVELASRTPLSPPLIKKDPGGLQQRLESLVKVSKQALLDTRYYIFDLKPLLDGNRSATEMVEHQVQEFRTVTSIPTKFAVSGSEYLLPVATGAGLYRIVQEGLANVYKHAQASKVEVHLAFGDGQVKLQINDNGRGFAALPVYPPDGIEKERGPGGYGLGNMVARARELGGRLDIDSAPGRGTRLSLTLPAPVAGQTPS